MATRVKGDLAGLVVRPEAVYGTMPAVATNDWYGGTLISFNDESTPDMQEDPGDGTMLFDGAYSGVKDYGFSATFTVPKGPSWSKWIELALGPGSPMGFKNALSSFSIETSVASDEHLLFKGCKIDKLDIKADLGQRVEMSVTAFAQSKTIGATRTIPKLAKPTTGPVRKTARLKYHGADTKDKTLTISISRALQKEAGPVGSDVVAAGFDSVPTAADATFTFTETSASSAWDILKAAGTTGKTAAITIDGKTISSVDCYFPGTDNPNRVQGSYDETITLKAKDMSVG